MAAVDEAPPADATPADAPTHPHTPRRRSARSAVVAGWLAGGIPFLWLLTRGRLALTEGGPVTGFFDVQARALLDGSLAVPEGSLGFEAFVVDGAHQMYFGPLPSLLRMPVLALTDALDGRLTQLSMLGAWVVLGVAVASLWRWAGRVVGTPERLRLGGWLATAAFVAVLAGGSVTAILAAWPSVYHEAILWGAAFAISGFALVVRLPGGRAAGRQRGEPRVAADGLSPGGLALLALVALAGALTRAPVGLAPALAVGLLVLDGAVVALRHRGDRAERPAVGLAGWARVPDARRLVTLALVAAVPVLAWAGVNQARFGTPVGLPMDAQVFTGFAPQRQAMLDANDGAYFRAAFVPTTGWAYLRPDGFEASASLPFLQGREPDLVGDVVLDETHPTPSLPAAMPVWAVAGLVGLVGIVRGRPAGLRRLRAPVLAAGAGTAGILVIGYVANRYLGDLLPLVVPAGIAGAHLVGRWWTGREPSRAVTTAVVAVVAVIGVLGATVSLGSASILGATRDTRPAGLLALTEARVAVAEAVDPVTVPEVLHDPLPAVGPVDAYGVVGDCDALYWTDGQSPNGVAATGWRAVERTSEAGAWTLTWQVPEGQATEPVILATFGDDPAARVWDGGDTYGDDGEDEGFGGRLMAVPHGTVSDGSSSLWHLRYEGLPWDTDGAHVSVRPGEAVTWDLVADPFTQELVVTEPGEDRQGDELLWAWFGADSPASAGDDGVALTTVASGGLCERLVAVVGESS